MGEKIDVFYPQGNVKLHEMYISIGIYSYEDEENYNCMRIGKKRKETERGIL